MRILTLILFLALPFAANAGCAYIGDITTKNLQLDISDGGCGPQIMIRFRYLKEDGTPTAPKEYPFHQECFLTLRGKDVRKSKHYDGNSSDGFSCHSHGHTPLAGASFKLIQFWRSQNSCAEPNDLGSKYICIKGCGKLIVPEYINGHDGTC